MTDYKPPAIVSTPWSFRWLAVVTCVTTYALIVLGGVVRVTESGDACPDWPRCKGELLPPLESAVLIEFSHRLLASVVGFLVLATALYAWRRMQHLPLVRWGAALAVLLVAGQIVLGGVTVLSDLPPGMVTAHLALASALLATLAVVALASFDLQPSEHAEQRKSAGSFRKLAIAAALATLGLMLTGSYVTGAGAGLAFPDWPLFDGRLLPEGGRLSMIHALHRLSAALVGVFLAYVALAAWREQRWHQGVLFGTFLALVLYAVEVLVGAANVWTLLQPAASGAHLALASAVWVTLVAVAALSQWAAQPSVKHDEESQAQAATPLRETVSSGVPAGRPS